MALSVEHTARDKRARVRDPPYEIPPNTLMAPGEYKIRRECNVFQVTIQNHTSGGVKAGD